MLSLGRTNYSYVEVLQGNTKYFRKRKRRMEGKKSDIKVLNTH